jgi:hypothetical protein
MPPPDLIAAIRRLLRAGRVVNPSDRKCLQWELNDLAHCTSANVAWMAAIVARGGAAYDESIPAHREAHAWPLNAAA